ncbi:hypothetical protein ACFIN9_26670 [Streptomyces noursei]|uniref:hypothetical protein n=1 Tax=Streptomyces noursei TaxID=1971 RepID=UPI0036D412C4
MNDALHHLHLQAGRPSLSVMAQELKGASISRSSIGDAFSSTRLPQWHIVDALVEILASRAIDLTPEQELKRIHRLWMDAANGAPSLAAVTHPTGLAMPRIILLIDIADHRRRNDLARAYMRPQVYMIIDHAMAEAGINESKRVRTVGGDSVTELIDAPASLPSILRALLTEVPKQLHAVNSRASASARIRLRAVLATGDVAVGAGNGRVGASLSKAMRLLDADFLREELRNHDDDFALCISEPVYDETVRHGLVGIPSDGFHQVTCGAKVGPLRAWLTRV